MEKIKFKMTADDYYRGVKFKIKTLGKRKIFPLLMLIISAAYVAVAPSGNIGATGYLAVGIISAYSVLMLFSPTRKLCEREFFSSPFSSKEKTVLFDGERAVFISDYQRISLRWEDVFAAEADESRVVILPVPSGEAFVISKAENSSPLLDRLCEIISEKCKKKPKSNKLTKEADTQRGNFNEVSDGGEDIPVTAQGAIDLNDLIQGQRMVIKKNRVLGFCYFMTVLYAAICVYGYVTTHEKVYLYFIAAAVTAVVLSMLFNYFVVTKKQAEKLARLDKFTFLNKTVIFEKSYFELITKDEELQFESDRVIPYAFINAAYESENYYSVFFSDKYILLPKRFFSEKQRLAVTQILKSNCFYSRLK